MNTELKILMDTLNCKRVQAHDKYHVRFSNSIQKVEIKELEIETTKFILHLIKEKATITKRMTEERVILDKFQQKVHGSELSLTLFMSTRACLMYSPFGLSKIVNQEEFDFDNEELTGAVDFEIVIPRLLIILSPSN